MTETPRKLEFRFDLDHIMNVVTFDESIAVSEIFGLVFELQQGAETGNQMNMLAVLARIPDQLKMARSLLSKLVWHETGYLDSDEAMPVVGLMSIKQIFETLSGLMERMSDATTDSDAEADHEVVES